MQRLCIELLERCTRCFCVLVVSPCNVLSDFIDERIKASVQRLQHTRRRFPCRSGQRNAWKRSTLLQGSDVLDRKSTRLNSSHVAISYAVFCLKKKKKKKMHLNRW